MTDEQDGLTPDSAPDGWCFECGDTFRLDDTGGYNPPCPCGCGCCAHCCRQEIQAEDDFEDAEIDSASGNKIIDLMAALKASLAPLPTGYPKEPTR